VSNKRRSAGVTLIELLVFIMIVGVALAGVLTSLNVANRASADPLRPKQALAIAEAMLTEVMAKDYCDPDANGTDNNNDDDEASCLLRTNVREATRRDYDAIDDYNGFHFDTRPPTAIGSSPVMWSTLRSRCIAEFRQRRRQTGAGHRHAQRRSSLQLTAYRANY
jgi:type II secretory pathway pseudopilin PulG